MDHLNTTRGERGASEGAWSEEKSVSLLPSLRSLPRISRTSSQGGPVTRGFGLEILTSSRLQSEHKFLTYWEYPQLISWQVASPYNWAKIPVNLINGAALTLTSVPTAVLILLHLTLCLQRCIFYVCTLHAAVCIHPTCVSLQIFKDFLFVPLCLHLKCKKNNGGAFLGLCDWAGNCYTLVHCDRSGTSAGPELSVLEIKSLPPPRWMCHCGVMASKHPFLKHFPLRFPEVKMERRTAAAEFSRWNLNRRTCSWFERSFSNSSPYRCHYNLGTDVSPEDITVLQSL